MRKCKKAENFIRKTKLLDACLNGNGDIFREIKKLRRSRQLVASSIDGNFVNVEEHFKEQYEKLYNSVEDTKDMVLLKNEINYLIDDSENHELSKLTPKIVKEAASKLKSGKSDPSVNFSTDCFKNAPDVLFSHLSFILKTFLTHGHITNFLLLATLVPIIKNRLGCINNSKNYRSMAISSLVL